MQLVMAQGKVHSILAIQYLLFCYREESVAECYLLCFLQEQFRNVLRLLNGKNKVNVSQLFFRNSYSVIYVIYCIVLHCSNQYTLYKSLRHPGSLRGCSLCQPVVVAVVGIALCH